MDYYFVINVRDDYGWVWVGFNPKSLSLIFKFSKPNPIPNPVSSVCQFSVPSGFKFKPKPNRKLSF